MQLDLIKSGDGKYKIISSSNIKHEALEHLARLLSDANKSSDIKIGIYSISGGHFSLFKRVYSYITGRSERMNKSKFYKFMRGKYQMKAKKHSWKGLDPNKDLFDLDFLK